MKRAHLAVIATSAAGLALTAALAGPLNPPAGPVTSTYKTLDQVEPRIPISDANTPQGYGCRYVVLNPGSYYLTGNVAGATGASGILIMASNVTLDLNGFTVSGASAGIQSAAGLSDVTVRNGTVSATSGDGVRLDNSTSARVENVTVRQCAGGGITVGRNSIITSCRSEDCYTGFLATDLCQLTGCLAAGSHTSGFTIVGAGTRLTNCTANACLGDGFTMYTASDCRLDSCSALSNQANGFWIGSWTTLTDCAAQSNGTQGYNLGNLSSAQRCRADGNAGIGFALQAQCTLRECVSTMNHFQGVSVGGADCTVVDSQLTANGSGSAGLWLQSTGCHAEGNKCNGQGFGIFISGGATGNFVARNTCHANAVNFGSIPAGNSVAPIVTNPGSNNFSTMTPWSNVAY